MIIGVGGKKGAGKDSIGDYLVAEHGFEKLSFANDGKDVICGTFDITREQLDEWKNNPKIKIALYHEGAHPYVTMTLRQYLQRWFNKEGMKAVFGNFFWTNQLLPIDFDHRGFKYVITDLRFFYEAMRIKELGGYTIEVIRPSLTDDGDTHESEEGLPIELVDFFVDNGSTLEDLGIKVNQVLDDIAVIEGISPFSEPEVEEIG